MSRTDEEGLSSDIPVGSVPTAEEDRPSLSEEVISAYVSEAVRSVPGIVSLHGSAWQEISSRVKETLGKGVLVTEAGPGTISVEIHVRVAWGVVIPDLAKRVTDAVKERVVGLLGLNVGTVTLFVDEIDAPPETT